MTTGESEADGSRDQGQGQLDNPRHVAMVRFGLPQIQ